jgi:hypothetical protein
LSTSLIGAQAATYYVATTGSDSNPGTSSQPFRTITYAYGKASAGTTIMVAPGTYTDYSSGWGWHLNKSGTASSPIVLKSTTRGGAILDGQFASHDGIYLDGSYNVIDGFGITRAPITGVYVAGNANQIINCEIYNNGTQGSSDPEGQGIYSSDGTSGNQYVGNYIHDNGYTGSNLDHGLYLCGQNEVVANNVVVRHPSRGLQLAGYSSVSNTKVYNNVFAWNGKHGITVWMQMSNVDIRNNICFQNGLYGVQFYAATGSGVTLDHNLVYGNGSGNYSLAEGGTTVSYTLGTTISSDPKFANESSSSFDAHLNSGSPAIGAGLNEYSTITTDYAGAARPSSGAWDLGAYVYGSSSQVAPPTVNLTAPGNGTTVSGSSVTVSANASSSNGIASVQFKLDGANLGAAVTSSPYNGSWNSISAANGTHTLTAVATDKSGNQTTSAAVSVNVNNALPSVTMTSPANNTTYAAPATVNLTASVTPNGHTITAVKFYNGSTLLGQSTTAPYTCAWNNVGAAVYGVNATAVYDSGSTVNSSVLTVNVTNQTVVNGLTFAATSGTISAPFYITNNNAIVQPAYTTLSLAGQAVYNFNVSAAGNYVVTAQVNAPGTDNNSFFVNIDAQPTDPGMIWDVPVTSGFASQTVSWRGNGTADTNSPSGMTAQYAPAVFNLSAGTHQLIVCGREGMVQLGTITIAPYTSQSAPPTVSIATPANNATVSGPSVTISANASSSVGVANVQFVLDGATLGSTLTSAPYNATWDSTTIANGSHTLTAVATDTAGAQTTSAPVTLLVSNSVTSLPVVSVTATAPNASRVGPTNGVITITRTGSTSAALTVNYSLSGSAVNGVDYGTVGNTATIPAGSTSATVTIAPQPSTNLVGTTTAALTLTANSAYTVGSPNSASVLISDNSVPSSISNAPGHSFKITWNSVSGKSYVVAYKTSLSASTWTTLSGNITATGSTTSYVDSGAAKQGTRYYIVYVTN